MTDTSQKASLLQQLLNLHAIDQRILSAERELKRGDSAIASADENAARLEAELEKLSAELERLRGEARANEKAADAKRDTLSKVRSRVNRSQNERQYSASSLEFDLVRQDLRALEDRTLEKLQAVEELEAKVAELTAQLEEARAAAEPVRADAGQRRAELEDQLAVDRDRRENLAIRLEGEALGLYERIRSGRQEVAVAPLTAERVCGNCYTAVTIQQEMQIKGLAELICCEGCGVILYPEDLAV